MTVTAKPTTAQAAVIAYFHDGTKPTVRTNQATDTVCLRNGWTENIDKFPFARATDAGIRAIGRETPTHLYTGLGEDATAVCGEQVGEQTKTATSIDGTTCRACTAAYEHYRAELGTELGKFARGEAPYDQEAEVTPTADAQARRQLGMDADDVAAVAVAVTGEPAPGATVRGSDGREYGSDATVEVTADGDPMRGRHATVTVTGLRTGVDAMVLLRFEGMSTPVIRYADEVCVIDEAAEPAGLPSGYNDDPVEDGVDEAALWTPDPLPVPDVTRVEVDGVCGAVTRRVEPAPTSVQIDGRAVVFADASLVELVTVCRDESARSQHLDPHEGRRYFRARAASDAALDEIKRRLDTLHRAAAAAGPGNGLHDVLAVLDAADRRPAAGPPTT